METVKLTITDVAYGGKGIARLDGCVVFVPGVLPGEVVEAQIIKRHKNYAEAGLLNVITPSPARIAPECPLSSLCQGCRYQHTTYSEEIRIKQNQFLGLLQKMGGVDASLCLEPLASPLSTGYRNKITLHASVGNKKTLLGYYGEDNTSIIDVRACPLATEPLNKLLEKLRSNRDFMLSLQTKSSVTLRYTRHDGALAWKGQAPRTEQNLTEDTPFGTLRVPRNGFFQVNASVLPILMQEISELVKRISPQFLIDMYCGVGVFALAAAKSGVPHVLGIDSQRNAIETAKSNALYFALHKTTLFLCDDAESGFKQAMEPVDPAQTAIIFDPPRRGLEKEMIETVCKTKPADLIYISCAADTLARDIALLKKDGYFVVSTRLIDMFPRTQYFESITHLSAHP